MKKMKRNVWILTLLLTGTAGLRAQESLPITLDKAVEIGLSENPTVQIADQEIRRMEYVRKEAMGNLLPNLSGTGNFTHNIQKQKMFMGGGFDIAGMMGDAMLPLFANLPPEYQPDWSNLGGGESSGDSNAPIEVGLRNSVTGGLSLSVPLFMPTIYKNLQLSEQQILSAVESARQNKITLANQIKKSYYGVLLAESSLEVLKQNIGLAETVVANTRASFEQGVVSEYDLITAEVQLSNLQPTLIQTENSIRIARLTLNMLLSLPLDTRLELQEKLYDFRGAMSADRRGAIDLTDNADLRLIDIQGNMLQKQLELQRAQRMPSLAGFAQYQVLSQSEDLKIGHYRWLGSSAAGMQLNIPLFAGFTNKRREQQTRISIDQLKMQRDYREQSLNLEAQTALNNIEQSLRQMAANEATRAQAEKGYRIAKTRFDVEAGTMVELNSAQMALLQADLNYSQSIFDYLSAQADYDRILGNEDVVGGGKPAENRPVVKTVQPVEVVQPVEIEKAVDEKVIENQVTTPSTSSKVIQIRIR
jgi:outer membrane protein TolC